MSEVKIIKPFLKWVGGKSQLIHQISATFPTQINNYHEIFLGGGSILLYMLSMNKGNKIKINGKIFAYDLNKGLINTFIQVQQNPNKLIQQVNNLYKEFKNIETNTLGQKGKPSIISNDTKLFSREHYYYWIRNKFNSLEKNNLMSASYFIFLNKTCFRGIFREGVNGFNVPYGLKDRQTIPRIISDEHILQVSSLIQDVNFVHQHFSKSIANIKKNDFAYLDPPYAPENKKSFVGYTLNGFTLKSHELLFKLVLQMKNDNKSFVMSNSNTKFVCDTFLICNKKEVVARRAIHSKNPGKKTTEIIIWNHSK